MIKTWFDPHIMAISKLKRHLLDLTLWTTVLRATTAINRWRHICFYWKRRWKQMWRHLSIVVVALKTVVQRVRSNRWRFNFKMVIMGGQINFLWKTAMIITITKTSILIICPVPRILFLTYPISPPPRKILLICLKYHVTLHNIIRLKLKLIIWDFTDLEFSKN